MEKRKLKKSFIIIIAIVLVLIVCSIIISVLLKNSHKSNENSLKNSLTEMGRDFYENFYYEQIGKSADERTNLLAKYTNIGIKVDLENLATYNNGKFKDKVSEFINNKTEEKCNKSNSKAIIYPKSPYGKTDYTIEVNLDCGFESK